MKYDAIIIGSGLGGLECAYLLAREGRRTLVLEKATQPGGCLQSYRRNGMAFDTGLHYTGGLGEGESLQAAFDYFGLRQLPWRRLDPDGFDRIRIGDRDFAFAQGYRHFSEKLAADFPGSRSALEQYARMMRQANEEQLAALASHSGNTPIPTPTLWETNAYRYLCDTFRDPLLVNVLAGTSIKMELRRASLPLFTFVHGNSSFVESSWRLQGNGTMLVETLIRGIRSQGGEIICNAEVEELVEKGGQLTQAVCTNQERYEAKLFISDIHPAHTCNLVKQSEKMKATYRRRIGNLENTFGMFTVSLRLKPRTIRYFNWNQYFYKQPNVWTFHEGNDPVGGLLISCRIPEDGGEYAQQIDLLTPMRWESCKKWAQTKVGHRGEAYKEMKTRTAEECIRLAEQFIPGLRAQIAGYYTSTPLTYRDYLGSPEGSAYGLRKDSNNVALTVLSPRTPIPNLFLTGQNLMLHGLHGVTMTALFTCAEIIGKERIGELMEQYRK